VAEDKSTTLDPDLEVSFSGPATLVNRFIVTFHPSGVRIGLLERRAPEAASEFRTAILLSYQDAIELKNLLSVMLKPVEESFLAQIAKSQSNG
jgi:hypothetical protein